MLTFNLIVIFRIYAKLINYPKAHLEDPEHVRVSLCHPLLIAVPDDQEGVDELASLELLNDVANVLRVPSF